MIPIYRAKKIDSDEWVEGYYIDAVEHLYHGHLEDHYILNTEKGYSHTIQIDPNTLAIHFPNTNEWYSMEEMQDIIKRHEDDQRTV